MEDEEIGAEMNPDVVAALHALGCVRAVGRASPDGDRALRVLVDDPEKDEPIVAALLKELGILHYKINKHSPEDSHE